MVESSPHAAHAGRAPAHGELCAETVMKMMLIAALLITLPAIIVAFFFFGRMAMIPALASLGINSIPFLVAGWLLRKQGMDAEH
jgi:hypothetical protein